MPIETFISNQAIERQIILAQIHQIILEQDKTVKPRIGLMMGSDMIIYEAAGTFKYGLSSVKKHMSLHLMPIYCSPVLHQKYKELLNKASFQKGCINFKNEEQMPLAIVKELIMESSKIDLLAILESYRQAKK